MIHSQAIPLCLAIKILHIHTHTQNKQKYKDVTQLNKLQFRLKFIH